MTQKESLYLIDGSSYIFRAYHALPPLSRKSDGLPVGAVQGFCTMLWKLLHSHQAAAPSHFAVIFDKSSKTFRNEIYPAYKAHRPEAPADLRPQFGLIRQAVRAFGIPCVELDQYEADDLIATYAQQAHAQGMNVRIVSPDKDLMQLIKPGIELYDPVKNQIMGEDEAFKKFGVPIAQIIDVQALAGDSVDNIPGVPGIGLKTGAQLIVDYGSLENLLERAGEIKQPKRRESLIKFADQARLSKKLATLELSVPIIEKIEDFIYLPPQPVALIGFLKALEFSSLVRKIAAELGAEADLIETSTVQVTFWPIEAEKTENPDQISAPSAKNQTDAPDNSAQKMAETLRNIPFSYDDYETILTQDDLARWIALAHDQGYIAIDTETTSLDALQAELVGISLSTAPGKACYIPLNHKDGVADLLGGGRISAQMDVAQALMMLQPLLQDPSIVKIGQNLKYDFHILAQHGITLTTIDDTMLLSYVLESGKNGHGMDELSLKHLNHRPISFKDVTSSGKSAISFDHVTLSKATHYAAEDADITLRLWLLFKLQLLELRKVTVYETLERPLMPVLANMEQAGILINDRLLGSLSGELAQKAFAIEQTIYHLAGENFNIGSPKQLGTILFEKLGIQAGRKTSTGAWSTDQASLEELAASGIELARHVLDWRQLTKLRSTYTDALPQHINPNTGRVHTSYAMASTSTGRLASSDPNLQNIPARSEEGRKIRSAFIAPPGKKLISADYSQIELRLLAHIADIGELKQAFAQGVDIHALTASEIFNVPLETMDPLTRRRAKAINFGIIYGISAFGLANQLDISREDAAAYIKRYFERFPAIRTYMEDTKLFARKNLYVETIFGRRCHFPRITSPNAAERAFMERAAINAPIQGSAADIIRRAMIHMHDVLQKTNSPAKLLLQVHDELVFEVPEGETERTITLIKQVMEKAPEPTLHLSVPLQVGAKAADNWEQAH